MFLLDASCTTQHREKKMNERAKPTTQHIIMVMGWGSTSGNPPCNLLGRQHKRAGCQRVCGLETLSRPTLLVSGWHARPSG